MLISLSESDVFRLNLSASSLVPAIPRFILNYRLWSRPSFLLAADGMVQPDLIERRHLWGKANLITATSIFHQAVSVNKSIVALMGAAVPVSALPS